IPYVMHNDNLWYVNGLPSLDSDYPETDRDAPFLILADVLHDVFNTGVTEVHRAVIRLEDVSVVVGAQRLSRAVDYLSGAGGPFALGLIPAQRLEDGRVISLDDQPEFVRELRRAERSGATIVLHGYHHTFGSGEDYEFWDEERKAPLAGETWEMYA